MNRRYSQRQARALAKRVEQLERILDEQRAAWSKEWPAGVHIGSVTTDAPTVKAVSVARRLGHACVLTEGLGQLHVYALPLAKGRA